MSIAQINYSTTNLKPKSNRNHSFSIPSYSMLRTVTVLMSLTGEEFIPGRNMTTAGEKGFSLITSLINF